MTLAERVAERRSLEHAAVAGVPALAIAVLSAQRFGRFNGGKLTAAPRA